MADPPSYDSRGLVNLVAEIESRLIGSAPSPRLDPKIGESIPDGATYVVVLFDGLGIAQLDHEMARSLANRSMRPCMLLSRVRRASPWPLLQRACRPLSTG